ncbi:unnamed protein product [Peniophora sp. CBMAI 1063]|nr:unnamed protein product [Peniophora sp. CBMAI 1063]
MVHSAGSQLRSLRGPLADPVRQKTSEVAQDPPYEPPFASVQVPTITEDLSEAQYGDSAPLVHPRDTQYATEAALSGAMLAQKLSQGMPSRGQAVIGPQHILHATSAWNSPVDPLNTTTLHPSPSEPIRLKHRHGVNGPPSPADYESLRMKKKQYAKTFRDNEKHYFEELRRRLFPTDPNVRYSECLERALVAFDELETYKARDDQRDAEIRG